jgi:starvation-inducible DNA-binding protein
MSQTAQSNVKPSRSSTKLLKSQIDLPEHVRQSVVDLLNQHLADIVDLASQIKQAHWNVRGPHFIGLHELFDQVHDDVSELVDEIAERAGQLGGLVQGTVRVAATRSRLDEYPLEITSGRQHVQALAGALAGYGKLAREAIDTATELKDADTADLFTQTSRAIDKLLWKVEAHGQASE